MSKLKVILFFLTLLIVSCKDVSTKAKSTETVSAQNEISKPNLTIEFKFKTNKPGIFKIMMNNIEVDEIQKKNIHILENVSPSTSEDTILANFDAGNMSNNILINLGNSQPKKVEIISISVSYGEKFFNLATPEDLDKYLAFNKCIERSGDGLTINTKRTDGLLNPLIYFRLSFINLLKKQ